jgi:hypothetical protein
MSSQAASRNVAEIEIISAPISDEQQRWQSPTLAFHNWPDTESRDKAIVAAFNYCGMTASVKNVPKHQATHARKLEITLSNERKLRVWLDQGFGYWQIPRSDHRSSSRYQASFPFNEPSSFQGESLGTPQFSIDGQPYSTHMFVEKG